jgi:hypothetical protein
MIDRNTACLIATWDVTHEVVRNLTGKENPFSPLIDNIYKNGFMIKSYDNNGLLSVVSKRGIEEVRIK